VDHQAGDAPGLGADGRGLSGAGHGTRAARQCRTGQPGRGGQKPEPARPGSPAWVQSSTATPHGYETRKALIRCQIIGTRLPYPE